MDSSIPSTDGAVKKRVLLTGAAGFLGSHCLKLLLDQTDWEIICPVTFQHRGLPERLSVVVGTEERWQRVTVVKCDLSSHINDTTRAKFGNIDYIINYAAESHVNRSITDPVPFIKNNVDIALNILEYARVAKPEILVYISTDEVYGSAPDGYAHTEWDPIIPSSPYSASKAAQEAIAISYWRTYGVPLVLVQCMNLIGEMQDPEKYVSMIINKVLRDEKLTVHVAPDGRIGSRFYLHARVLADAVLFLVNRGNVAIRDHDTARPDRWNVVGDQELDNLELAQLVAKLLDRELIYELQDFNVERPGHDRRYALDGSKLAQAGWTAPVTFEESLRELVQWALANPFWTNRR
jgi:dTDP-glucose 4,6-dehydratase